MKTSRIANAFCLRLFPNIARHYDVRFAAKILTLLLIAGAAMVAQAGQTQNQPSLAAGRAACAEDAQKP